MAKKTAQKQEQMTEDEKQIRRRIGNATKADLAKWFMQIWNENNELKKQMNKKLEESKEYQSMVNQLQDETQLKKTAVKQQKKAEETAQKLEAECEKLRQQVAALQTAKSLPDATETAQNTADKMSDGQATDDSETAQNGTQGGIEAIAESLPENIPLGKWQQEMVDKLRDIYDARNQNLKEEAAVKIVRIWCATQKAEEALGMLYDYILVHLPQESDEQDEPDTISGFACEKIEALQEKITELEAKIEGAETTAQYNSVTEKYKVVNDLRNELNNKNTALGKSEAERNTLKSDLDKLQEKYQQATRHNARGAGRKPKLTDDQVQEIQKLRADGMVMTEISKKIGCSVGLVYNILSKNK